MNMRYIATLILSILFNASVLADVNCFIIKKNGTVITQEGECRIRHTPCSTFKIAISLMGYNEGILLDEIQPELPFQADYIDTYETWRQPHNPTTWFKNSCVWFSQVITKKLGFNKFTNYLAKFNYGNQDASGNKNTNNGLTNCWLSSSLKISPLEQMEFLEKLATNQLTISQVAQEFTSKIMYIETLSNGWKLYGKTGGGYGVDSTGLIDRNKNIGWFVGWIEKDRQKIIFVNYLEGIHQNNLSMPMRAKIQVREKITALTK